jgi:hypothetical protein
MAALRLLLCLRVLLRVKLPAQAMQPGAVLPRPRALPLAACALFPPA